MNRELYSLRSYLLALTVSFFVSVSLSAQSPRDRQLEKNAVSAFHEGKYREALPGFNELLGRYPRDPMYNYYVGVCLASLRQEPEKAVTSLRLAALSKVPGDVFFYLGRASYQIDDYNEAIRYFERFRESSDARTRATYNIDRWINVCQLYLRNPQHTIDTTGNRTSYQKTLDAALVYQHKLDSVRYLIKKEEQIIGMNKDKQDRLTVLSEEESYYEKIVSGYFSAARKMEMSGVVPDQNSKRGNGTNSDAHSIRNGGGGSPFLEQTGDLFYKEPGVRGVFDYRDQERLDELMEITGKGNKLMEDAQQINSEIEKYKVVANAARNKREVQQAKRNITQLEDKKMEKRMEAIGYYKDANDEQYALYNKYLDRLMGTGNQTKDVLQQAGVFREEAQKSHRKVISLRGEATKEYDEEKKYDKLMEANAYELISLDNQKKALGTLTGLIPVAAMNVDVTRPVTEITEKPVSTASTSIAQDQGKHEITKASAGEQESEDHTKTDVNNTGATVEMPASNTVTEESAESRLRRQLSRFPYGFTIRSPFPYDQEHPIPETEGLPEGVNYKIQIAAFSQHPDLKYFKGMYPLSREDIPGKNVVRYYAGLFRTYDNALETLLKVRKMGFPDALIVGFYNGERSSLERIRWLEDDMPYENISGEHVGTQPGGAGSGKQSVDKEEERGLVYRVQLGAFRKPLSDRKVANFKQLAGNKMLKVTQTDEGIYVYSIGNFLTFEEASSFKKILLGRGVEGVFVTAWNNGKRIPVKEIR